MKSRATPAAAVRLRHRLWPQLLLLAALCCSACTAPPEPSGPVEMTSGDSLVVEVNSKAPGFAARTLGGDTVRLADLLGQHVVLLEFWSIFCKSCIEEMPHIEALQERYREDGLVVLSVNTDVFSSKKVASFMQRVGIDPPYPVLRDQRQELVQAFGVELLPVTVIVDRDGWIRLYQEGYRPGDERRFEKKVRSLLRRDGSDDTTLAPRDGVTRFAPAGTHLIELGTPVEQRELHTLQAQPLRVAAGQVQLLYFWSLYCQPCREEYPAVARMAARYAEQGLQAVAINIDSPRLAARVSRFTRGQDPLPCVMDSAQAHSDPLSDRLGVAATPTLLLLDRSGAVAYVTAGSFDPAAVEREISTLLQSTGF